jgi:hypothetical protein
MNRWAKGGIGALVILGAVVVSYATDKPNSPDAPYKQSWAKSYSDTTCADWQSVMTPDQRHAAAADILTAARNKIDSGTGLPPGSLVTSFENDISQGCTAIPTETVTDVGFGIYHLTGHDTYKP